MNETDWTITRPRKRGGLELLAIAGDTDLDEDSLDEDEDIEIDVTITYEEGYFIPGRLSGPPEDCYPDDGEDPEIISVVMLGGFEEHDITETLTGAEIEELVQVCINHQADSEGYAAEEAAEEAYSAWKEDRDLDY